MKGNVILVSVIAAKVYEDKIVIASDSIICNEEDVKRTNFKKLQKIKGIVVGGCGSAEELSLFFQFAQTHEIPQPTVDSIQEYAYKFSLYKEKYTQDAKIENVYLMIVGGCLFELEGMFVQEITDYTACGKGQPYALAALYLGHTVKAAVKVACDLCCFVSEPVVVFEEPRNIIVMNCSVE